MNILGTLSVAIFAISKFQKSSDPTTAKILELIGYCSFTPMMILEMVFPLWLIYFDKDFVYKKKLRKRSAIVKSTSSKHAPRTSSLHSTTGNSSVRDTAAERTVLSPRVKRSEKLISRITQSDMLKLILIDPESKTEFARFLAREHALESLLFLEAIKRYKEEFEANISSVEITHLCSKMVKEFMTAGAINEVNLPRIVVNKILNQIEMFLNDNSCEDAQFAFDDAEKHISEMLVVNYVRKFNQQRRPGAPRRAE